MLDELFRHVQRDELISLSSDLIKFPSFKNNETPVAHFLADWFGERGYEVELDEVEPGRLQTIATLKGTGGGGNSLMFNAHTDINSLVRGWERDPWQAWVEGDKLFGHGVQNMKGGLATIMVAADAFRKANVKLKGDLVLACVVGETQGGEGMHHLMKRGFRTDMAVITEPYGKGNLVTVHAGIVHMAVHVRGRTAHMSRPQGSVHAIHKMVKVIEGLGSVDFRFTPRADLPGLPLLNVGSIIGGRGESYYLSDPPYIPDMCTIIVDVHFLPGQTVEGIVADIGRRLDEVKAADPEIDYEIQIPPPDFFVSRRRLVMPPLDVPSDERIVQTVARNYEKVTGEKIRSIGSLLPNSYTACDTSWLWDAGIPCLNYGPTTGNGGGGPENAFVIISEMEECAKVLIATAEEICVAA